MSSQSSQLSSISTKKGRSKIHEDQQFKAAVISFVKPLGCLYDSKHKDFDDDDAVADAWQIVVDSCKVDYPDEEEELLHRVQKAWENCKKAFSKERCRREQPHSSNSQGWSLYDKMSFMEQHMRRIPKSEAGKKTTKKRKLPGDTQSQSTLAREDSPVPDNDQVQQDEEDFELERRERRLKELEERALRARQLDMKAAQLEAERDEARRRAEMQHQEREQRKREREAREQDQQKQQKKQDCEKRMIKITAEHVVATLDSMENEDDRRTLIKSIMDILFTD